MSEVQFSSALLRRFRSSRQKVDLILKPLRRQSVKNALRVLESSPKKAALQVKKLILSAMANAEHNYGLDIDQLEIATFTADDDIVMKRIEFRGRSKMGRITKPFCRLRVVLRPMNVSLEGK